MPGQENRISILQVATSSHVFIFDLFKFPHQEVIDVLNDAFQNPDVEKLGIGLRLDFEQINK